MVVTCAAVGCTNRGDKKKEDIHFHRFPFSRPHILHQWVAAVKREKWTPTKNSFLCSEHFTKESYEAQLSSGRWYLKEDAVPELFNYPERLHKIIKRRKPLIRNTSVVPEKKLRTTQDSVELHSNSNHENDASSSDTLTLSSVRPPTTAPESPKKQVLKRKVKTLQQKLRRKNVRITTKKELLKELKSKTNTTPEVNDLLQNYFSEFPLELLQNELKNKDVKKNGARYTEAIKQFSLTLYFYSSKAYRYVRTMFKLPHPNRLSSYLSKFKCEPGFISEVFKYLKANISEKPWLKDCTLIIDSMSLRKQIQWDTTHSRYSGMLN